MDKTLVKAVELLKNVINQGGTPEEITGAALYFITCDECANRHDRSYDENKIEKLAEKYMSGNEEEAKYDPII